MPNRNEEYYLEDVVFQVEDQLFKVHQQLLVRLSPVLRDMFKHSAASHDSVETDGLTDKRPLVLEGVEKKDFIPLLRCLYPMRFPVDSNILSTFEEWQSVLKLSSLYEMAEVKTFVIGKMEPILVDSPSLQIYLAKTYDIQKWLAPGFYRLAERAKPLDPEDVRLVGLSDSLKVCALREKSRRCVKCGSCGAGIHSDGFSMKDIGHTFGIRSVNLPSSEMEYEQSCACSSSPAKPDRTAFTWGPIADIAAPSSRPNSTPKSLPFPFSPGIAPTPSQLAPASSAAPNPQQSPLSSSAVPKPSQSPSSPSTAPKSSQSHSSSSAANVPTPSQSSSSPSTAPESSQSHSSSNAGHRSSRRRDSPPSAASKSSDPIPNTVSKPTSSDTKPSILVTPASSAGAGFGVAPAFFSASFSGAAPVKSNLFSNPNLPAKPSP